MNYLIISSLVLLSIYSASAQLLQKCPDEKAGTKAFADMYDKFRTSVCKPCKGKVGESEKSRNYIKTKVCPMMLTKPIIGVDPPKDVKDTVSDVMAECSKVQAEGDYCGKAQQEAFVKCLEKNKGKMTGAGPWALSNCKTIQDHMTKNADQIKQKLAGEGKKYVDAGCGEK